MRRFAALSNASGSRTRISITPSSTFPVIGTAPPSGALLHFTWTTAWGSNNAEFLAWVILEIMKEFGLKDLGAVKQFLGVEFIRNMATKELWMHQSSYIANLLDDLGMKDCNPAKTPMDTNRPENVDEPVLTNRRTEYRTLISKLLFLSICTRPDISYAVNSLAQYSSAPR